MAVKLKKAPDDLQPCVDGNGKRFRPDGAVFTTPDGAIALHRMQYLPKKYAVSHIESGYLIESGFTSATAARDFLQHLLAGANKEGLQWMKLRSGHNADERSRTILTFLVKYSPVKPGDDKETNDSSD